MISLSFLGEKPFQCDKCDYKCRKNAFLLKHKLLFHKIPKPKRPTKKCAPSTSTSADGEPELEPATGDLPSFVCDICGKSFNTKDHLRVSSHQFFFRDFMSSFEFAAVLLEARHEEIIIWRIDSRLSRSFTARGVTLGDPPEGIRLISF